jgi:pimeloyl-ACP methyl ester carboxylesterase
VMDAARVERAAIMGVSEGGSLAVLFAAAHPERCSALVLYGAFARFSHWFPTKQKFDSFLDYVETSWGTGKSFAAFAPSKKGDIEFQRWWGRWERLGGSPSAVKSLMRMNSEINIDSILPSVRIPSLILHRTEDPTVGIQAGRFLAAHLPHAKLVELEGTDHMCWFGDNGRPAHRRGGAERSGCSRDCCSSRRTHYGYGGSGRSGNFEDGQGPCCRFRY